MGERYRSCPLLSSVFYIIAIILQASRLTVQVIDLESIRILGLVPDRHLHNLSILIPDLCRGFLDYFIDDLWVFL